jgi:hypothetical protein
LAADFGLNTQLRSRSKKSAMPSYRRELVSQLVELASGILMARKMTFVMRALGRESISVISRVDLLDEAS